MKYFIKLVICYILLFLSCSRDQESNDFVCEDTVLIDQNLYQAIRGDMPNITSLEIKSNCLIVDISDSGCTGDQWIVKLIDSDSLHMDNGPLRELKFVYDNHEDCDANLVRQFSFELGGLQIDTVSQLKLEFINVNLNIVYNY